MLSPVPGIQGGAGRRTCAWALAWLPPAADACAIASAAAAVLPCPTLWAYASATACAAELPPCATA